MSRLAERQHSAVVLTSGWTTTSVVAAVVEWLASVVVHSQVFSVSRQPTEIIEKINHWRSISDYSFT